MAHALKTLIGFIKVCSTQNHFLFDNILLISDGPTHLSHFAATKWIWDYYLDSLDLSSMS